MRAVFLDRDGTLNKSPPKGGYIQSWEEFEFLPGAADGIQKLNGAEIPVYIVTNQSCVNRGIISESTLNDIHSGMREALLQKGAHVDGIYYCPHRPDENCGCRKPKPGLLNNAAAEFHVDLSKSFMVGDTKKDILAGKAAGCKTVLLWPDTTKKGPDTTKIGPDTTEENLEGADYICGSISEALALILEIFSSTAENEQELN